MSPVVPSQVLALQPEAGDTICQLIVKFARVAILVWKYYDWMLDEDGNLSDEYKSALCNQVECPE